MAHNPKEFCNCEHAHTLREAIQAAYAVALVAPDAAARILGDALLADHNTCVAHYKELCK